MPDPEDTLADDPFVMAGAYALGTLEGQELAAARQLLLADRSFVRAVTWWEHRLAAMGEAAREAIPSENVWRGIESRLDEAHGDRAQPTLAQPSRGPSGWSIATALAGVGAAAAAALVLFLAPTAGDEAPLPQTQFVAQIQDAETGRKLASIVDPQNDRLALSIAGLATEPGQVPVLWVIPAGGAPVSLGPIPESGSFARGLSAEERSLLVPGATLAVTFEEDGGDRYESPTMPILLTGTLDRV